MQQPRQYPTFEPGRTSTADYVRSYYALNNLGSTARFAPLRTAPAATYRRKI